VLYASGDSDFVPGTTQVSGVDSTSAVDFQHRSRWSPVTEISQLIREVTFDGDEAVASTFERPYPEPSCPVWTLPEVVTIEVAHFRDPKPAEAQEHSERVAFTSGATAL